MYVCMGRFFVMELVLHCADISNPYKPFAICAQWADLVVEEFCKQGDREKAEVGCPGLGLGSRWFSWLVGLAAHWAFGGLG